MCNYSHVAPCYFCRLAALGVLPSIITSHDLNTATGRDELALVILDHKAKLDKIAKKHYTEVRNDGLVAQIEAAAWTKLGVPARPEPASASDVAKVALEAFLASSEVQLGANLYCPFKEFRDAWKAFAMTHGFSIYGRPIDSALFRQTFDKFGLSVEKGAREYGGVMRGGANTEWVVGVRLMEDDDGGVLASGV